jgi:hypothetical protein
MDGMAAKESVRLEIRAWNRARLATLRASRAGTWE